MNAKINRIDLENAAVQAQELSQILYDFYDLKERPEHRFYELQLDLEQLAKHLDHEAEEQD